MVNSTENLGKSPKGEVRKEDKTILNDFVVEGLVEESINHSQQKEDNELVITNIIGNFGLFQFIVLSFSLIREGLAAYDAVITSVILKPVDSYVCIDDSIDSLHTKHISHLINGTTKTTRDNDIDQCYQSRNGSYVLDESGNMIRCNNWIFSHSPASNEELSSINKSIQLTIDWQLICDRQWLLALIETIFFIGIAIGNPIFGYLGDTLGRRKSYLLSHLLALFSGTASLFITSYWPFVICRLLHGIGASGFAITYSMFSEVIGAKYRSNCSVIQHFGWGLFLMLVPVVNKVATNHRHLLAMSPAVALITLPIAFWIPESARWMMVKERYDEGKKILLRIAKFNGIGGTNEEELKAKLDLIEKQVRLDKAIKSANGQQQEKNPFKIIFTNKRLLKDTFILSYLVFLGQFLYFYLTLNYYFVDNLSLDDNFFKSALGEWAGIITLLILMSMVSRRTCFRIYLSIQMLSFIFQYLINSGMLGQLNIRWIIVINDGIGNLCAADIIFLAFTICLEVYPTVVRDTGKSIVCSLLEMGSTLSPMIIQLARLIGTDKIDLLMASMSFIALVSSEFLTINKDNTELTDNC